MTLQDLCDPLFQEICRLNRLARKGGGAGCDLGMVATQIRNIFEEMKSTASSDVGLHNQYLLVEHPLVYFVDFMISHSSFTWAKEWRPLEPEFYNELVGEQRFYDLLDETLADANPAATDRLEIFYNCLGLGFTGVYFDDPPSIRKKMLDIRSKINRRIELDAATRIVPDSELHVNTSNLYQPAGPGLTIMGIALVGLILVFLVANFVFYEWSKSTMGRHLEEIAAFPTGMQ